MPHEYSLSPFGLRLIKAYEGFRPVETVLINGQSVIGYGHKYAHDEPHVVTKRQAQAALIDDLRPYEAMVNDSVFAPLSQSQFDALVSLAFNIGPKAFMESRVLHWLNQGRPLDAARAFDDWRKSEINGKVYIVAALVRRRTAEKSLFLRPGEGAVSAPRMELPPVADVAQDALGDGVPRFDPAEAETLVENVPIPAKSQKVSAEEVNAEQNNGEAVSAVEARDPHVLTLNERVELNEDAIMAARQDIKTVNKKTYSELKETEDAEPELSPIAIAANEVSDRLDRLMAEAPPRNSTPQRQPVYIEETALVKEKPVAANEGVDENYKRTADPAKPVVRGPYAFITREEQNSGLSGQDDPTESMAPYWVMLLIGLGSLGFGIYKWFIETPNTLQGWATFAVPAVTIFGALLVIASIYYLIKGSD